MDSKSDQYLNNYGVINMYASILLTSLGLIGNLLSLLVLIYARNKLPRIMGAKYLIILTLSNTMFLLLRFYIRTFNSMIYHFKLDYLKTYQLLDSCVILCKTLPYLTICAKLLNTMLTLCFSLERLFAVYCPIQMRSRDSKYSSSIFVFSILFSFVIPFYMFTYTELVPNNSRKMINIHSHLPSIGNYTCLIRPENFTILFNFHFVTLIVIFISNVVVSLSILAIVVRLKKSKNLLYSYKSKTRQTLIPESSQIRQIGSLNRLLEGRISNNTNDAEMRTLSQTSGFLVKISEKRNKSLYLINYKIQDTKILTSLSFSFILLNTPYLVAVLYIVRFMDTNGFTGLDLAQSSNLSNFFLVAEILQLLNFSFICLLFFCSGRIFRLHAFKFFKKCLFIFSR